MVLYPRYAAFTIPLLLATVLLGALRTNATPVVDSTPRDVSTLGRIVKTPPASNFVLNGLQGQRPRTRTYDFVVSEMKGAPDGFAKPMLVVNGVYLSLSLCWILLWR